MKIIAAADRKWGIGRNGCLLVRIPEDQRFFRDQTLGHTVVMGRKTLESLPGGKPLEGRETIVLTRSRDYAPEGVIVVHSPKQLRPLLDERHKDEVFCAGGEQIYHLLLGMCDTALITLIDREFEADAYMPDLDRAEDWILSEEGEWKSCRDIRYRFSVYRRINLHIE